MSSPRRLLGRLALGAAAVVGAVLLFRAIAANAPPPVSVGERAPRFAAVTLDSIPVPRSLDDYAGAPVILNVWATWCDPCREEMPSLERAFRDYRERGLRIVAISIDDPGSEDLIRGFAKETGLTFDILHDPKTEIMKLYQVAGVPQTFLISHTGEIVATRFVADWSAVENRALIDSLMRAGAR